MAAPPTALAKSVTSRLYRPRRLGGQRWRQNQLVDSQTLARPAPKRQVQLVALFQPRVWVQHSGLPLQKRAQQTLLGRCCGIGRVGTGQHGQHLAIQINGSVLRCTASSPHPCLWRAELGALLQVRAQRVTGQAQLIQLHGGGVGAKALPRKRHPTTSRSSAQGWSRLYSSQLAVEAASSVRLTFSNGVWSSRSTVALSSTRVSTSWVNSPSASFQKPGCGPR